MEAIQFRKATPNMNLDSGPSYPWSGTPSSTHTPHPTLSTILFFAFSLAYVRLVHATLSFVTYFSQSQTHAQSRNIIGHLHAHSSSHNTFGQCLLYNVSHTAVSLVLCAVDKGLRGRNVLQSLLLILLRICSRSVRLISTK